MVLHGISGYPEDSPFICTRILFTLSTRDRRFPLKDIILCDSRKHSYTNLLDLIVGE
jgi:hypothetical protein